MQCTVKMRLPKILLLILIQVVIQQCSSKNIIEPLNGLEYAQLNKDYSLICHYGPGSVAEWMESVGHYIDIRFNCRVSGISGSKTTKLYQEATTKCNRTAKTLTLEIKNITRAHNGSKIKCITQDSEEEYQIKVTGSTDPPPFLMITFSKKEIYDGEDVEVKCRWKDNFKSKAKLKCGKKENIGIGLASLKLTLTKEWNYKYCTCEGLHYDIRILTHGQIIVYSAPSVSVNNITATAGTMAVLNCSASDGYPDTYSYLEWHHFFNNNLVEKCQPTNEDGSLVIPNTTWQDAGTWICFVSNGIYNRSNQGYLKITGPPILQALNPIVGAISGTNKKLEVQIFPSYDNIDITWRHNGKKISKGTPKKFSSDWQQKIKDQEVYLSGLTVSLVLNDVQQKDGGNYSVTVVTKDGTSLYNFRLRISEKTDVTLITAGLICGTLALIFLISIFACIFFCSRRQRYHSTKIDPSMNTPRTRIFSVPKHEFLEHPTSNLELDIYEEIDDWNDNDFNKKKEDSGYLNPAVIRYT